MMRLSTPAQMISQALTQPTLRRARPSDLGEVSRLLTASSLPVEGVDRTLSDFLVAEHDGALVGVVGLEVCCAEHALLRSTAVDPEWRGRGLGRQLVEHAIADAESRGFHALWLLTTTAERYFPSFGFTRTTRDAVPAEVRASTEFTSVCPSSASVMTLGLPRASRTEAGAPVAASPS